MEIRKATIADINIIHNLEKKCFLLDEVLSIEDIKKQILDHQDYIFIGNHNDIDVCYLSGLKSNLNDFDDGMFNGDIKFDDKGKNFFITGLCVDPEYQNNGFGKELLFKIMEILYKEDIDNIILTCKEEIAPFYEKIGFKKDKISNSNFAGKKWLEMRYKYEKNSTL